MNTANDSFTLIWTSNILLSELMNRLRSFILSFSFIFAIHWDVCVWSVANYKCVPVLLFRYTWVTGREPLTYYDMNLSAQDHQTFFTCDSDHLRPADASKQTRIRSVHLDVCAQVVMWPLWLHEYVCLCVFWLVAVMQKAWRERNPQARISAAHEALELEEWVHFLFIFLFLSSSLSLV